MLADIRDMRRSICTTSPLSLDYMASIYDDAPVWKQKDEDDRTDKVVFTKDPEELKRYNAIDCVEQARVYQAILNEPEWAEPRTRKLYEIHTRLSQIAAEMYAVGLYVHVPNRKFMEWALEREIEEKVESFLNQVNIKEVRCTPNDLRALIFKRHESLRIKKFSLPDPVDPRMYSAEDMRVISVDESSLLMLMVGGDCPPDLIRIIDAYWEAEQAKKRLSFLRSKLLDHALGRDGRLRPSWNSCGTDTMRFSCSEPNVMQIEKMLRAYIGPSPGCVLIEADKSQLELRVMEAIADDGALLKALQTGDVYGEDAKDWYGLPREMNVKKLKPAARQQCKIIHLASQYAAGVPTIFAQALREDRKFTFNQTRLLNNGFKRTYSRTVAYWHEEMRRVHDCGFSQGRLLDGRRYYPRPPPITEIANWPVQRTASEMMATEMIELFDRLKRETKTAKIVIILHDAFYVECKEREANLTQKIMAEVMDREYTIDGRTRPFPIEMKIAHHSKDQTWASVEPV
jgi:DNA polymerase I-like protein with 3'-5' exonuclease and polymerase domains